MIGKGLGAAGWLWLSLLGLFLFTAGPLLVALTAGAGRGRTRLPAR